MNACKQAILYVTRKWGKSMILFLVFLVIATMALSGLTIQQAAKTAKLNVREALGGSFVLNQNTSDPDKWVRRFEDASGYQEYYAGEQLTDSLAEQVMQNTDGLKGWNGTYLTYVVMKQQSGKLLDLLDVGEADTLMASMMTSYAEMNQAVTTLGSTNTQFDSYFQSGFVKLVDGRHLQPEDRNAILISRELAEQNGLAVGDMIVLSQPKYKAEQNGIDLEATKKQVELIGLFDVLGENSTMFGNWAMENAMYTGMDVIQHVRPEFREEGYEHLYFYAKDPGELEQIVSDLKAVSGVSWEDFIIDIDTGALDTVMEPLQNLDRLMTIMVVIMLAIGAVILYLILAGRIKERIHESGILLSLGKSKAAIILQYITEAVLIAAIAFSVSYFTSYGISKAVGTQLLEYSTSDTGPASAATPTGVDGMYSMNADSMTPQFSASVDLTDIDVEIAGNSIAIVFTAGFLILCLAVLLAAIPIVRMKPKEIMSKMS